MFPVGWQSSPLGGKVAPVYGMHRDKNKFNIQISMILTFHTLMKQEKKRNCRVTLEGYESLTSIFCSLNLKINATLSPY